MTQNPSKLAQAATLVSHRPLVLVYGRRQRQANAKTPIVLTQQCHGFPQSVCASVAIMPQLRRNRFSSHLPTIR